MSGPPTLAGRTALVTGAHGLLGGWLVQALLAQDVSVITLRRRQARNSALEMLGLAELVTTVQGDICDPDLIARILREHDVDSVFHLAADRKSVV